MLIFNNTEYFTPDLYWEQYYQESVTCLIFGTVYWIKVKKVFIK